jgi:hypothetical protein
MADARAPVSPHDASFYDILTGASKAKLYGAIFFIFAVFGILWDFGTAPQRRS